jgi:hypothetical protein
MCLLGKMSVSFIAFFFMLLISISLRAEDSEYTCSYRYYTGEVSKTFKAGSVDDARDKAHAEWETRTSPYLLKREIYCVKK